MDNNRLALLVLSCDAYKDLWEDFFNLRDRFWPDCPFKWYLITETVHYDRKDVNVIQCGNSFNWAGRLRFAIKKIDADYFGIYLEDYFITSRVQNNIIYQLLNVMKDNGVTFINTSDVFCNCINMKDKKFFQNHLIVIPNDKIYGLSTESGIWEKNFLLEKLGSKDYSAWQFEIDRVNEAKSPNGLGGFNLCDDRMPFNVSVLPVVIQGNIYPPAKKFFKKIGYSFLSKRHEMTIWQVIIFDMKMKLSNTKYGKRILKWFASKFLGVKFYT